MEISKSTPYVRYRENISSTLHKGTIHIESEYLDRERKTTIESIEGQTWQNMVNGENKEEDVLPRLGLKIEGNEDVLDTIEQHMPIDTIIGDVEPVANEDGTYTYEISTMEGSYAKTLDGENNFSLTSDGLVGDMYIKYNAQGEEVNGNIVMNNQSSYTIENSNNGEIKSAILSGNTLVNISIIKEYSFSSTQIQIKCYNNEMIKTNTEYTVIYDITDTNDLGSVMLDCFGNTPLPITLGNHKIKFTTLTSLKNNSNMYMSGGFVGVVDNIMIIEGDYTNKDIPYFEGMQSVQAPGITMIGKNLFDKTTVKYNTTIETEEQTDNRYMASDFIEVEPNANYISNHMGVIFYYNRNKKIVGSLNNSTLPQQFMTPNNCKYIRIRCWNLYDTIEKQKEIVELEQLEKGTSATPYEPYKSITLSTPSDLELRKVGEVQDEVNATTGEVVERIGEIVLDGSENWSLQTQNDWQRYMLTIEDMIDIYDFKNPNRTHCDKLVYDELDVKNSGSYLRVKNQIAIYNNEIVRDVNQFKQWLSQNPITVQYQLATPTTKTVDLSIVNQDGNETKLRTFDDTTHVLLQSEAGPNPSASLTVRTKIPSASSTSLLMDDISMKQEQLNTTVDEQSNNVDATMIATTEIYEETL